MEVCTASDLNISRLVKTMLQAYLHLAQILRSSMPSFLPGIPICLSCSDSKAFTGDLTTCQEILISSVTVACQGNVLFGWLRRNRMSIRTRLKSGARFVSWIMFACHIHHNICEKKNRRQGDPHHAAARIVKSIPCRKPQMSPLYTMHYCVFTASLMWFPSGFFLLSFHFIFFSGDKREEENLLSCFC